MHSMFRDLWSDQNPDDAGGANSGFLFASQLGVMEDDGTTDMTARLEGALNKAISQGKMLVVDRQNVRMKTPLELLNLPKDSELHIWCPFGTRFIADPELNSSGPYFVIQGTEIQGSTAVVWNSGNGFTPVEGFPYTELAEDVVAGWVVKPLATAQIEKGDLIKIQSHRLPYSEHRYSDYRGELNRVRAVNPDGTLELDEKLAQSYTTGILHSTTVAGYRIEPAAFHRTAVVWVQLAAASTNLAPEQMFGLRTTLQDGQVRYLQYWNPSTLEFGFPISHTWDQLDYSPAPVVGQTITFDAKTYIFLYKPIKFSIQGAIFDASEDVGGTLRGFAIAYCDEPIVRDCASIDNQVRGLSATACYHPLLEFNKTERSNWETLGYSVLFSEVRNFRVVFHRSANCRRMVDCGGACQSVGGVVEGGRVTGGWKTNVDTIWDTEDLNYGIGDHGQSLNWVYQGQTLENVQVGCIFRGTNLIVRETTLLGQIGYCHNIGAGEGHAIINQFFDDRMQDDEINPAPRLFDDTSLPALVHVNVNGWWRGGYKFNGPLLVDNFNFRGARAGVVAYTNGLDTEAEGWILKGIRGRFELSAGNTFLFGTEELPIEVQPPPPAPQETDHGLTFYPKKFTVIDCGVFPRGIHNEVNDTDPLNADFKGWILRDTWMAIDKYRYAFHMSEDTILEIPLSGHVTRKDVLLDRLVRVTLLPITGTNSDWRADFLIQNDEAGGAAVVELLPSFRVVPWLAENIGVDDPVGSLNIGWYASNLFRMRNRLGHPNTNGIQGIVEFSL